MSAPGASYAKLKTHLRFASGRLKLLKNKKTGLAARARREVADLLQDGKIDRAKIRVENIVRQTQLAEALEIVEMYCDLLLTRFDLITNMRELDEGLAEAVSSIIWATPTFQSDCFELKVVCDLLTAKYGQNYAGACRNEVVKTVSEKLKRKLASQNASRILVEKYLIEIAKYYDVPYEPDPQVEQPEDYNFREMNSSDQGGVHASRRFGKSHHETASLDISTLPCNQDLKNVKPQAEEPAAEIEDEFGLLKLPSVPDIPGPSTEDNDEAMDLDELTRRFMKLRKTD